MKKIFLSLFALIFGAMGMYAQTSLVATLQHGSNIQAFYGEDALSAAHEAAVNGDVITLSSGQFNGCDITKAITLRGEGFSKTSIKTAMNFAIPNGITLSIVVEGLTLPKTDIWVSGTDGTEKIVFTKCYYCNKMVFSQCNATVVQCMMPNYAGGLVLEARDNTQVTCINSVIAGVATFSTSYPYPQWTGKFDIQNCIIPRGTMALKYSSIANTIVNVNGGSLHESNTSTHCLVKGMSGFSDSWSVDSWDGIFENGMENTGGAWYGYDLTDDAKATYLGTDGKTVGIIGGMYPYDETPDYPLVKTLDVIGTHTNGKLNVKINVE